MDTFSFVVNLSASSKIASLHPRQTAPTNGAFPSTNNMMHQSSSTATDARTTQRGSALERLWNKKVRHPWEENDASGGDDDDDLLELDEPTLTPTPSQSTPKATPISFRRSLNSSSSMVLSPPLSSGSSKKKKKKSKKSPKNGEELSSSKKKSKKNKRKEKKQNCKTLPNALPFENDNDIDDPVLSTENALPPLQAYPTGTNVLVTDDAGATPAPATTSPPTQQDAEAAASDMQLLSIDFERDGPALRTALAEEVLAMWDAQGLYMDLPELRPAILQGVVAQKFQALVDEQRTVQAKYQSQDSLEALSSLANGRVTGKPICDMSIIAEGTDEEDSIDDDDDDDDIDDEHHNHHHKKKDSSARQYQQSVQEMPTLAEEGSLMSDPSKQTGTERTQEETPDDSEQPTQDEEEENESGDKKLNAASLVMQELSERLLSIDTKEYECVEAVAGDNASNEVPIQDQNAFTKFRLRHAVEQRVSQVFTGDFHVVEASKEEKDREMNSSSKSLPDQQQSSNIQSPNSGSSKKDLKHRLSQSFSHFDSYLRNHQQPRPLNQEEDEWTEYTIEKELRKSIPGSSASESDPLSSKQVNNRTMPRSNSKSNETLYEEYTIVEETAKEEEDSVVDVDALSEQRSKQRKDVSIASPNADDDNDDQKQEQESYLEYTIKEATPSKPERLATSQLLKDAVAKVITPATAASGSPPHRRPSVMDDLGGDGVPVVTTHGNTFDDDEMTQITFDYTMDGMNSVTQDHERANAYLDKSNKRFSIPSPPRKQSAVDSQDTQPTRASTLPQNTQEGMDNSMNNRSTASSADLSSQAAQALAKSVAKILRVDIWSPKVTVAQTALEKLSKAACSGSYQRSNIVRLGGIIAILRAMQMHPLNVAIQKEALSTFECLSADHEASLAMGDVGAISAIATCLQSHMDQEDIQVSGCKVMAAMTKIRSPEESHDADGDDVPVDGAVPALVASMTRYAKNSDIQAHAFCACANLCMDNRERLQELSEVGGLTSMTMALQKPWKSKMDQHEAISTLSILLRSLAEVGANSTEC